MYRIDLVQMTVKAYLSGIGRHIIHMHVIGLVNR